jgi:hypothetical protein
MLEACCRRWHTHVARRHHTHILHPDYDSETHDETDTDATGGAVSGGLPGNVFGTIVYRLYELQPQEDNVPELVTQLLTYAPERGELSQELDENLVRDVSTPA